MEIATAWLAAALITKSQSQKFSPPCNLEDTRGGWTPVWAPHQVLSTEWTPLFLAQPYSTCLCHLQKPAPGL